MANDNLRLYPIYACLTACSFWLPVFFLYFAERVGLRELLWLEAVYYACVVLAEVPSGYFSDRYGRRRTLLASTGCLTAAYALFVFAEAFAALALAQALLGFGYALNSGTDTAFHSDSLDEAGLGEQYGEREAKTRSLAFFVAAVAMPVGAGVAALETRFAYGLNLLTAAGSFAVAMSFTEPARAARDQALDSARAFRRQLAECAGDLRDPTTAWIFYYAVFMTVLNHIPYEFYQSRIESWTGPGSSWAPLISGLILSAGQLAAAAASRVSIRVSRRFGDRPALLSTLALQTAVIGVMGALVHPIVAAVIVLRSVPDAVGAPILLARVAEKVPSLRRATFLSLQSLAGRLAYSLWLLAMSVVVGGPPAGDEVPALLFLGAGLGVAGGLVFAFLSRRLR